jgi:hypothetical protein
MCLNRYLLARSTRRFFNRVLFRVTFLRAMTRAGVRFRRCYFCSHTPVFFYWGPQKFDPIPMLSFNFIKNVMSFKRMATGHMRVDSGFFRTEEMWGMRSSYLTFGDALLR